LKSVVEADGSTITYSYDANGNVASIARTGSGVVTAISHFAPAGGPPGTTVTINGAGFSSVAAQNVVKFNGVTATVVTANPNVIRATVPASATTGPISVTTPAGTATSSTSFVVNLVSISGFTPQVGTVGTPVTITGTAFSATPANNSIAFNGTLAPATTATTTQLQTMVPPNATSGRVTVTTPSGSATSSADFVVPIAGYVASDVVASSRLTVGGIGRVYTINAANKVGVALFDATVGQRVSAVFSNISLGGWVRVYKPDGTLFAHSNLPGGQYVWDLEAAPVSGTYSLYFMPGTEVGSATLRLVAEVNGVLAINGSPTVLSLAAGQNADFTFSGLAGQQFNFAIFDFSSAPAGGVGTVSIYNPDGSSLMYCGGLSTLLDGCRIKLPTAGTYRIRIDPYTNFATAFTMRLNIDLNAALALGTPFNLNLATPGRHALLSFAATAGQTVALNLGGITAVPAGTNISYSIRDAAGVAVDGGNAMVGDTKNLRNLAAGTYTVLIRPNDGATAAMQVTLAPGLTGSLPTTGVGTNYATTVPGQNGYFTFAGTVGQNLSLGLTNLVMSGSGTQLVSIRVTRPDGSYLLNTLYCYTSSTPGCQMTLRNLPVAGNYNVEVMPSGYSSASYRLTLSTSVQATLAAGTPYNGNLQFAGQNAVLSFTATAGEVRALNVDTLALTPAGTGLRVEVYDPNNLLFASTTTTTSHTFNLTDLLAGTYRVVIAARNAATGTLRVRLVAGVTGALSANGTSVARATSLPDQNAYFTFAGTAGQNLSFGLTDLVFAPVSASYATVRVFKPDNTSLVSSTYCYPNNLPGCQVTLRDLPVTGTYKVQVFPAGGSTMTFKTTLSASVTSTLTAGTPATTTLQFAGQNAILSFSATAGQTRALNIGSLAMTPAGSPVRATVYSPTGTVVESATSATGLTFNLRNLVAGTYRVVIEPTTAAIGSMQVTLVAGVIGTLTANGTTATYSTTVPKQSAYFTFAGTAGQHRGLAITGISTNPSTVTSVSVRVLKPDNSTLDSDTCNTSSTPGCSVALRNLPVTGTYTVEVTTGYATMSFGLTLSQSVTGSLVAATPLAVNLSSPGQNAVLTFTATAGQSFPLALNSLVTTPAASQVITYVYGPSGTVVGSRSGTASYTINLTGLAAGTYTVLVRPTSAATATMQVRIQ
jgi:trimeric autotransporter adhesin